MQNINESKVLLDVEIGDTLKEGNFNIIIDKHDYNIVFGECVEVIIIHDIDSELCFCAKYRPGKFPEDFYRDLNALGWDWLLDEIKERF